MKKYLRLGATGAVLAASLGMTSVAHAQDTATADAFAEILTALQLNVATGTSLDFGAMVVTGAGTVSLAPDNTLDCSVATIVCSGSTGVPTFEVAGTPLKNVTVKFDASSAILRRVGGVVGAAADELVLDSFTSNASVNNSGPVPFYEVSLDGLGDSSFEVGGDLNFDGSEVPGVYQGSFDVSVEYS